MKKVIILGAGPTGLGAAWRLQELKHSDWQLFEKESYPGGLSASFVDGKGFTWDFGGHVQFSHYKYFDRLMATLLGDQWFTHQRESWVWIFNRFIPYPFQYNIHRLPKEELIRSLEDLVELVISPSETKPRNFEEWILRSFGRRIADIFMLPYNFKVWAYPPRLMDYGWIGERVATIDLKRLLRNVINQADDVSWGPNNTFAFPKRGGTGSIWQSLAQKLPQKRMHYKKQMIRLDIKKKQVFFQDGTTTTYDTLITTLPLDLLIRQTNLPVAKPYAKKFLHSATNVVGLGLRGIAPVQLQTKCWKYFPENNSPFYRSTVFSNYSRYNVPDYKKHWSLMVEISESRYKRVNQDTLIEDAIVGAMATKLIRSRREIISIWTKREERGYPTPFIGRDSILDRVLPMLEKRGIYSRGRFGAWKYEVGNQDHSLMQGVEAVDRILLGKTEQTVYHPEIVNKR